MKKKILATVVAAAMCISCIPVGAMAAGSAKNKANVKFSAGIPERFDMVDESLTVTADLAEKYFPEIRDNEPDDVTFADAMVAAHEKKYGKNKVKNHLNISNGEWGSQVNKQFGHTNVGMYFADDKALATGVSDRIRDKAVLYAGASAGMTWDFGYSYFSKKNIKATAGKELTVKAFYQVTDQKTFTVKPAAPVGGKIMSVNKKNGKMVPLTGKTDKKGTAKLTIDKAGVSYISLAGKENTGFGENSLAGALAKVTVNPDKVVLSDPKAGAGKASLKWKKTAGAQQYQIYRGTKKNGTFKKVATVRKTGFTNKKLDGGSRYFYKVRAIAKADGKTYKGSFSKVKSVKTK